MIQVNVSPVEKSYWAESATSGVVRMRDEKTYFMRRAAQERSAADRAFDANAKKAHLIMADRYRDLVRAAEMMAASDAAA